MSERKIKSLISEYLYEDLGFPIKLHDVVIVEDRGFEYPLINHKQVMMKTAFSLVSSFQPLDGARLKFVRRFMAMSLDQFAAISGTASKSTISSWEKSSKICPLTSVQLRRIYFELKNEILRQVGSKMDSGLARDLGSSNDLNEPLDVEDGPIAI